MAIFYKKIFLLEHVLPTLVAIIYDLFLLLRSFLFLFFVDINFIKWFVFVALTFSFLQSHLGHLCNERALVSHRSKVIFLSMVLSSR